MLSIVDVESILAISKNTASVDCAYQSTSNIGVLAKFFDVSDGHDIVAICAHPILDFLTRIFALALDSSSQPVPPMLTRSSSTLYL